MAEREGFQFEFKYNIEVEKSTMNQACRILDDFYKKYENKKMKIDTNDMVKAARDGISKIQSLYQQGLSEEIPWWDIEDGLKESLDRARKQMNDFFAKTKLTFSDGLSISALDDNLLDAFNRNATLKIVDLTGRISELKSEMASVIDKLKSFGAVTGNLGRLNLSSDKALNTEELEEKIRLVKQLIEYQKEMEEIAGGKFSSSKAPIGKATWAAPSLVQSMRNDLEEMREYDIETTALLAKRRALLKELSSSWNDDSQSNATDLFKSGDINEFEKHIQTLKECIASQEDAIQKLSDNSYELFSNDYYEQLTKAQTELDRLKNCLKELQDLKLDDSGNTGGNVGSNGLSDILTVLSRIEEGINGVVKAFKPLTDAISSENNAIGAMVKANISDLEVLQTKFEETFNNIKSLSEKQFNVTNVISGGNSTDAIKDAANEMNKEGKAASDAVPKKNAFVEANEKVAQSMIATGEAGKVAAEGIKAEVETARAYDKVAIISDNDGPIAASKTKSSIGSKSVNTVTDRYIYDDEEHGWKLNTSTLIKDYKAYDKLQTDAQKKIAKAQAMLQKFMSQFDNKTAGKWSNTGLYQELKGTLTNGIGNVDNIDAVINKMQLLDAEYNKVVQSFRKGTKSMNPFVNAFNNMDEMDNKVRQVQLDFQKLKFPGDKLTNSVGDLPSLLDDLKKSLEPDDSGIVNINRVAEAYGNLNAAIKAANTAISTQRKEDAAKSSQLKAQEDAYENAIKAQEKLYNLKKQMVDVDPQSSKGQDTMRKIIEAQNEYNEALSKTNRELLSIGQIQAIEDLEKQQQAVLSTKKQEYKTKVSTKQEKEDLKYILSLYKQYTDAEISLQKLKSDTTGSANDERMKATIDDVKKAKEALLSLGIDTNNIAASELLTENQKKAVLEAQVKYKKQIRNIENTSSDKAATKQNKQNQNYGKTIFNRESRYAGVIDANLSSLGDTQLTSGFLQQVERYKAAYKELETLRNTFENSPTAANDSGLTSKFQESALSVERFRKELIQAFSEYQKFSNITDDSLLGETVIDETKFSNAKSAMIDFASSVTDGKFKLEGFSAAGTEMYGVIDKGHGVFTKVTVGMNAMTGEMKALESGTSKATSSWSKFSTELQKGAQQLARMYLSLHDFIRIIKQGVNYVKEIDLAMTELKKVTNETDEAYAYFLKNASKVSAVIGSTVSDFTDATAAFARLGYTINEATGMAESAIVYKNVADGLDTVEEATDSIISTMAAFGIEANDTMSIVDKFNAVGNSFAITSAGIGDALQRSASALYSAGNSIDESVALVTAANSVIQNPEQVGTALKTLALRLRGAKVELEEAGEDVDGMAESTSQLQEKLLALTHGKVDIMIDSTTFKNTTQILREMSEAWEYMTDIERAAALELMGGRFCHNV